MTHEQAMAVVSALYAEDTTDYGRIQHNGRFLDALRVAFPHMPDRDAIRPYWGKRLGKCHASEIVTRKKLGQMLIEMGAAVADCEEKSG